MDERVGRKEASKREFQGENEEFRSWCLIFGQTRSILSPKFAKDQYKNSGDIYFEIVQEVSWQNNFY